MALFLTKFWTAGIFNDNATATTSIIKLATIQSSTFKLLRKIFFKRLEFEMVNDAFN